MPEVISEDASDEVLASAIRKLQAQGVGQVIVSLGAEGAAVAASALSVTKLGFQGIALTRCGRYVILYLLVPENNTYNFIRCGRTAHIDSIHDVGFLFAAGYRDFLES
jgi:hypothetical protein